MKSLLQYSLRLVTSLAIVFVCLASGLAQAGWRSHIANAEVIGQGELSYFGFRVYTARLLGSTTAFNAKLPFALQLTYHRAISRDDLVEASLDLMSRQQDKSPSRLQLQNWQKEMQQAFIDVEPGQQITGVFLPGEGCRFYVGEHLQHAIRDPIFAQAFFDIWLAPDTTEPELRQQLLGKP